MTKAPCISLPPEINEAMRQGAALAVSISGGKDGQALINTLPYVYRERGWTGPIFALHMDLGRAEWPQTPAHVERIAAENGLPLIVVRRPQGDLVQEIQDRMEELRGTGKPFWPSSASRYCTADQKRGQADVVYRNLDKHLAQAKVPFWPSSASRYCTAHQKTNQADKVYRKYQIVISAEGIRAQESRVRAKKLVVSLRQQITAEALRDLPVEDALAYRSPGQRVGINWYPLLDWSLEDVWQACGTSREDLERRRELYRDGREAEALAGWPAHVAYVFGNDRLSCALCVLASDGDIRNGARHNPELYRLYRQMEIDGGSTFKHGRSLADIVEGGNKSESD